LGSFEIEGEDSKIYANEGRREKAADLLKRLALEKRLLKDQAVESLWPEIDLVSGTNNLYRTIHLLRLYKHVQKTSPVVDMIRNPAPLSISIEG
jgi:DNA-binding SARP family transcriptional activator